MVVTLQQVYNGVSQYVEKEIAAKSIGMNKFMAYFIIPSIPNKVNEIINKYESFLKPYFDDNGNVIIDELYKACTNSMARTIQVEWNGFVFKQNDIDMLCRFIEG